MVKIESDIVGKERFRSCAAKVAVNHSSHEDAQWFIDARSGDEEVIGESQDIRVDNARAKPVEERGGDDAGENDFVSPAT